MGNNIRIKPVDEEEATVLSTNIDVWNYGSRTDVTGS